MADLSVSSSGGSFASSGGLSRSSSSSHFPDNNAAPGINSFGDWINNAFTGNIDFKRQQYLYRQQVAANNATAAADRQFAADQNALTRAFNAAEAQKDRDFQQRQSETQYLRAAAQLKQLGINPAVLAFGGSAGTASAASGAAASASSSGGGSHHVSGASWNRSGNSLSAIGDIMKIASSLVNVAAMAFA